MDDDKKLGIRCGTCGRRVAVALTTLVGLRTFNCQRCRRTANLRVCSPALIGNDEETTALLAQIVDDLSDEQRSMLIRKLAGFSDRKLIEVYGRGAAELDELVERLADRIVSLHRS